MLRCTNCNPTKRILVLILGALALGACQRGVFNQQSPTPLSLAEAPAVRLNFRFEPDVPGPAQTAKSTEERNAAIQSDFDQSRAQEVLDRTLPSPDKKRTLAVYHRATDVQAEF